MTHGEGTLSRLSIAGGLALAGFLLITIDPTNGVGPVIDEASLDRSIDSLLLAYGVPPKAVNKRVVRTLSGAPLRTERRVLIPPGFSNLDFNRDLSRIAGRYFGIVSGTERTREMIVVLHVVLREKTVQSISLVTEN